MTNGVRFEIPGAPYPTRGYMSSLHGRLIEVTARERDMEARLLDVQAERTALQVEIAYIEGRRMGVTA
jgi:hypothetical protein